MYYNRHARVVYVAAPLAYGGLYGSLQMSADYMKGRLQIAIHGLRRKRNYHQQAKPQPTLVYVMLAIYDIQWCPSNVTPHKSPRQDKLSGPVLCVRAEIYR